MSTVNIIAREIDDRQLDALKAILKAFNIEYELTPDKPYDKRFVKKMLTSKKELAQGKTKSYTLAEIKALCK